MEMPIQIPLQGRTDCPAVSTFRICPSCRESPIVSSEVVPARPVHPPVYLHPEPEQGGPFSSTGDTQDLFQAPPMQRKALSVLCHILAYPSVQACFHPLPFLGVDSLIKPNTPHSVSGSTSREANQWQSSGVRGPGRRESQCKSVLSKPETLLGPLRRVTVAPWEWSIGWPLPISSQNCP